MRSTRGKTRAMRASATKRTQQVTAPLHSTERERYGSRELPAGVTVGYGARIGWGSRMNTNTQLARGGISSYYRSRQVGYGA